MSVATAPAAEQAAQVTVTPQEILGIADDITTNVLIERASEMRVIVLGSLAGVNVHQLGPAGTAKSLGLREYCTRIVGARYFSKTVHAQMPADALIGTYDMPEFVKTGHFARNVTNYLPNAHVANIDEVTRANGPTLDALLPMLNSQERMYEANGGMATAPTLFFVTASNYMPDPDDPHLGAFVDRLTLMQYVEYVKADDSFKEMVRRDHARRMNEMGGGASRVTVTLEQFQLAQRQVKLVEPRQEFLDKYADLRRNAKAEGLTISDRAWIELALVCRASAWLAGRDFLVPEDLAAIEPGLWRDKADQPTAHKLVLPFHGRFERESANKRQEAAKALAKIEEIRPEVEGTPPNEELDQEVLSKALSAGRQLAEVNKRVTKLLGEAANEQRDAAGLRELASELEGVRKWLESNNLPANW